MLRAGVLELGNQNELLHPGRGIAFNFTGNAIAKCLYITHTLLYLPDVQLTEGDVVLGVILAKYTQSDYARTTCIARDYNAKTLVRDIRAHGISIAGTRSTPRAALSDLVRHPALYK